MRYALALAVILALAAVIGASSADTKGIARFRESQVSYSTNGLEAGATETWRTRVWLLTKPKLIGSGVLTCIRADDNSDIRECLGTYILPEGRIQVAGEVISRNSFLLTVLGGAGTYQNAVGMMTVNGPLNAANITFYLG